jgi:HD-GYP domain-containing protein (c-di-GMP phosphodiesterase class II)
MRQKVYVNDLHLGMYVDELDRPWLETPFLFQGFPIRDRQELEQLQEYCEFVYILDERNENIAAEKHTPSHRFNTYQLNIPSRETSHLDGRDEHLKLINELRTIKKTYNQSHDYIAGVLEDVQFGRTFNIESGKQMVEQFTHSIIRNENALLLLTQLKDHDEYTVRHSLNACIMSIIFGKHMELKDSELRVLGLGGLLHDIGKMKIPAAILNKPGKLTREEFELVKHHPVDSYQLLSNRLEISPGVSEIALMHHERLDGTGYPRGLSASQLKSLPMMVAIIDVYDAITTKRAYHDGISPHEALKLMYENEIGAFNHDLLDKFIHCLSIFPVGSIVEMDNGEVGIVMSVNHSHHLFPIVLLVLNHNKQPYTPRKVCNLKLLADNGRPVRIKRILESNAYNLNASDILREENDFEALQPL